MAALVELTTGSFDPATKTLTYTAKPLPLDHAMGTATGHNKTELGEGRRRRRRSPLVAAAGRRCVRRACRQQARRSMPARLESRG